MSAVRATTTRGSSTVSTTSPAVPSPPRARSPFRWPSPRSTTVVDTRDGDVSDSGTPVPLLGGAVANTTMQSRMPAPEAVPVSVATATSATRVRSGGRETPTGLERRQAAHQRRQRAPFFQRLRRLRFGRAQDHQERVRQAGERDVPVPGRPTPHFVVVQSDLTLGFLEAGLDRPPGTRHPRQLFLRRVVGGETRISSVTRGATVASLRAVLDSWGGIR